MDRFDRVLDAAGDAPVSYTHLDDIVEPLPDLGGVRPAHDVALDAAPVFAVLAVADDLVLEAVVLCVHAAGAVSYTHLDVYKRQA